MVMSKLIQWNVLSLDGYFQGVKSWDVEWFHSFFDKDQEALSIEQLRQARALIFGRVTYDGMHIGSPRPAWSPST
jgi:dihydrofolate reductase